MKENDDSAVNIKRRDLIKTIGTGTLAAVFGVNPLSEKAAAEPQSSVPMRREGMVGPYNILLILTDQERYFHPFELPKDYHLPAHERLAKKGIVFENHRINSCVCTSSRSVLYTGRHIQKTRMFDNVNFPWISSMSTEIKTLGHLLREAGYYTAYKGKWHLSREFETTNTLAAPEKIFTKEMEAYGFSDYFGIGDIIAHTQGGYLHDGMIAAAAASWLRGKAATLTEQSKPWFLAVNVVNPHDVMFYDTDEPEHPVQGKNVLAHIAPNPEHIMYKKQWVFDLPASFSQRLDSPGRPAAHTDFDRSNDVMVGPIGNEKSRWRKRHNYYLNCLRDVDRHIATVLDELEATGLASSTIVILTSDHGDLDGAHRLSGKGATSYREQNNVPLIVAHPAYPGGKRCKAVTSHLDIAPTLVSFTNASVEKKATISKELPGKDFSSILAEPERASLDTVRDGQLFCFNMFATLDGEFLEKARDLIKQGKVARIKESGLRPDFMKRGAIRSVFDGRYQFTRYFSPKQHNRPVTIEELFSLNDIELFDLQNDPYELNNLALDSRNNADLLLAMNAKLNKLIDSEVGEDTGQMLPEGLEAAWVATSAVNDL